MYLFMLEKMPRKQLYCFFDRCGFVCTKFKIRYRRKSNLMLQLYVFIAVLNLEWFSPRYFWLWRWIMYFRSNGNITFSLKLLVNRKTSIPEMQLRNNRIFHTWKPMHSVRKTAKNKRIQITFGKSYAIFKIFYSNLITLLYNDTMK